MKSTSIFQPGRPRALGERGERIPLDPTIPALLPPEEKRRHRKQRLAASFRIFAHFGFDEAAAGYIMARDPIRTDCFWVNPFGMSFKQIRVRDLCLVDFDGNVVHGTWSVSHSASNIFTYIKDTRPEVVCVAHGHTMYSKAFASLHRHLRPLTQDACIFFEDHGLCIDEGHGVANNSDEGKRIAEAIGPYKAAIVADHGIFTVGQSVDEAVFWYVSLEHSCQAELIAMAAGDPKPIPEHVARKLRGQIGFPLAGWYSAQPMFEWILAEQPDCLEEE